MYTILSRLSYFYCKYVVSEYPIIRQKSSQLTDTHSFIRLGQSFPTLEAPTQQHPITVELQHTRLHDFPIYLLQLILVPINSPSIETSSQHPNMHSRPKFKKSNHTLHLLPLPHLRIPHCHLFELLSSTGHAIFVMALAQLVLESTSPLPFK